MEISFQPLQISHQILNVKLFEEISLIERTKVGCDCSSQNYPQYLLSF